MKKLILLLLLMITAVSMTAETRVIFVKTDGLPTADGSSWENAVPIDTARVIAVKYPDNQIWLKAGIYNLTVPFNLSVPMNIYGGFGGTETVISERNWTTNQTILNQSATDKVVVWTNAEADVLIDGLILQNGNKTTNANGGCGVLYPGNTLRNCIIRNNKTNGSTAKAGAFMIGANGLSASPLKKVVIDNCLIENNEATGQPTAILINNYNKLDVINTTIVNNYAQTTADAPVIGFTAGTGIVLNLQNSIIFGNKNGSTSALSVGNAGTDKFLYYNTWDVAATNGTRLNNLLLTSSPFILATSYIGAANGSDKLFSEIEGANFSLAKGSSCINAGNNVYVLSSTDLAGNNRINQTTVDMGCFESLFPTGFQETIKDKIWVANGKLNIPESKIGQTVTIYNTQGQRLNDFKAVSTNIQLHVKGFLIINIGGEQYKAIL